mgnify:FL=1
MEAILSNEDILRRVSFAPAFMSIPTVEAITDLTNDTDRALRELGYMTIDRRILLLDRQRACYLLGVQRGMEKYRNALLQQQGNALQPDIPFHLDRDESTSFIYSLEDMPYQKFYSLCAQAGITHSTRPVTSGGAAHD